MTDKAPEVHARALLTSVADIGTAAAAIDEAAEKLAVRPPSAPAGVPSPSPAPSKS